MNKIAIFIFLESFCLLLLIFVVNMMLHTNCEIQCNYGTYEAAILGILLLSIFIPIMLFLGGNKNENM